MIPDYRLVQVIDALGLVEDVSVDDPLRGIWRGGRRSAEPAICGVDVLDRLGDVAARYDPRRPDAWAWVERWSSDDVREVFVHRGLRAVLAWARGELTLVACATDEAFAAELQKCERFYGNQRRSAEIARRRREARRAMAMA